MATAVGMPYTTYKNYEDRLSKPYIPMHIVQQILPQLLGRGTPPVTQEEVLALAGVGEAPRPPPAPLPPPNARVVAAVPLPPPGARDVPVIQSRAAGWGTLTLDFRAPPVDLLPRPPAISPARAVWAVTIADASLAPRFEIGERLYCDPNRPPAIGSYAVVIEPADTSHRAVAHLGRLVEMNDESVMIARLAPAGSAPVQIPRAGVQTIARVLTMVELLGE
jgi:hypothetical protein